MLCSQSEDPPLLTTVIPTWMTIARVSSPHEIKAPLLQRAMAAVVEQIWRQKVSAHREQEIRDVVGKCGAVKALPW